MAALKARCLVVMMVASMAVMMAHSMVGMTDALKAV